jgi:hypothetical protein
VVGLDDEFVVEVDNEFVVKADIERGFGLDTGLAVD